MARLMPDIALDDTFDLAATSGDWGSTESTATHQKALIMDGPGDYKEDPQTGVGAFNYMDDDTNGLPRQIAMQFSRDGMNVIKVALLPDGVISSDAFYK